MRHIVVAVSLLLSGTASAQTATRWSGIISLGGEARPSVLEVDSRGNGYLSGPGEADKALDLGHVATDGSRLRFAVPHGEKHMMCEGSISGAEIIGTTGDCSVNLVTTERLENPTAQFGAWKMDDGRVVGIGTMADVLQPTFFDYGSGQARLLYYRGQGRFSAGPGMISPAPTEFYLTRIGSTLQIQDGKKIQLGHQLIFPERPVAWTNGLAKLSGTLILPQGRGPFPAVVLTQMSAPAARDAYRTWAYYFASRGIASLIYDRRGLGESIGDTQNTGMVELADDAVKAVQVLRSRPEILQSRVGVWGHSQGGWIAPLAASRSTDVAFLIMQSGPAVTAAEQEIYRVGASAKAMGLSDAEVTAATAYETALMKWVKDGSGHDELIASAKAAASAPWASLVELVEPNLPQVPSARSQNFWYFDPAPELAKVRVPLLAIYGDRDGFVPVQRSRAILANALKVARNTDATIITLPGAVHGMWRADQDSFYVITSSSGFHPLYWKTIDQWLARHHLWARR